MKPLVIYHANCADGFGAAFAAWTKFGDAADYVPMQYNNLPDDVAWEDCVRDREVYILDFSLPRPMMDFVFATAKRVVWLDHHKTAFEMWCGKYEKGMRHDDRVFPGDRFITLDDNKSGTYLAWEYFHPGTEIPMLIKHIDDYDRWRFKIEGTKAFQKALWSYAPWSFSNWKYFNTLEGVARVNFICEGEAILRAHDQNVQAVVKGSARKCEVQLSLSPDEYVERYNKTGEIDHPKAIGLAANCPPHLTSDVGHELAIKSGTFGLCWTLGQSGTVAKCSLRSNGEYDVSAIAKAFGGGGHLRASGFEVDIQVLLGWMK